MRIGVLTFRDLNHAGGSSIRIIGITKFLRDFGCDPVLFSPFELPEELKGKVKFVKFTIERYVGILSLLYTYSPKFMAKVVSLLKTTDIVKKISEQKIDILHCHQHQAGFKALSIRHHIKVPILFDEHGILLLQRQDFTSSIRNKILFPVYLRAEKNLFTFSNGLAVRSEMERDFIIMKYKISEEQVYVIPDGVDLDFFSQKIREAEQKKLIESNNLRGKKVILFAGGFKKMGGVLDLLRAFRILSRYQDNVALVLIGRGVLNRDIREYVDNHKLRNVILKGILPRNDLPKYQSIADILVVPNIQCEYFEMQPSIKLLECLASGKPTIATNLLSTRALVRDGENGILVEPGNPAAMAIGIRKLLQDDELCREIGRRGPGSIPKQNFWRSVAQRSITAYEHILKKRRVYHNMDNSLIKIST